MPDEKGEVCFCGEERGAYKMEGRDSVLRKGIELSLLAKEDSRTWIWETRG